MEEASAVVGQCARDRGRGAETRVARLQSHLCPSPCASFDVGSHQAKLPRVPLPGLEETLQRYLESVRPITTPAEFAATKEHVAAFLEGDGPRLQADLMERDAHSPHTSYVKPFWDDM